MKRILLAMGIATSLAAAPAVAFAANAPGHPMSGMSCMHHAHAKGAACDCGQKTAKADTAPKVSSNFTSAELRQIWSSP